MSTPGPPSTNGKQGNRKNVQNMVRHIVNELETLQNDLNGVVGDLKGLVSDIDSVTSKIEKEYCSKRRSLCHIPIRSYQANEPKKGQGRLSQLDEIKCYDESPDLDLSYLHITPGWQRPQWGRSLSFPSAVLRTPESQHRQELRSDFNATSFIREIPPFSEQPLSPPPVTKCYAQIKEEIPSEIETKDETIESLFSGSNNIQINSPKQISPLEDVCQQICTDIEMDILSERGAEAIEEQNSNTKSTVSSDGTYKEIVHIKATNLKTLQKLTMCESSSTSIESTDYNGIYETEMEKELENLSEPSLGYSHSEMSDSNMDFGSFGKSNSIASDEIEARYDREVNTWKSYTLSHRTVSSESLNSNYSDTTSDILNDNTRATAIYGNMIFSDNLVIIHSKKRQKKQLTF